MSQWHREFPELAGHPDHDPWMRNEGYRKVAPMSEYERQQLADERAAAEDFKGFKECGFCHGKPVGNAARWTSLNAPKYAPCPRCGVEHKEEPGG